MLLSELRTELTARGSGYLDETANVRKDAYLNRGQRLICGMYDWGFLETTATATSPPSVTDFRSMLYAVNNTTKTELLGRDQEFIRELDPTLESTGQAEYWYKEGTTTIKVWPVDTASSLTIRYIKVPPLLSAAGDTPVVPEPYQLLIIEAAMVYVYRDSDDTPQASDQRAQLDLEVAEMASDLFLDGADRFIDGDGVDW